MDISGDSPEVRVEVVTAALVAAGCPDGVHDLERLLENLNTPTASRHLELREPSLRPLYRGEPPLALDVPLLIRRDQIIFACFEGPAGPLGATGAPQVAVPVLLLAPPFQIQGDVFFTPEADASRALRSLVHGFFTVRHARVYDVDGVQVGDGDYVVVNGAAVEMASATAERIALAPASRAMPAPRLPDAAADEMAPATVLRSTRAA